jgi:hypothetical protein
LIRVDLISYQQLENERTNKSFNVLIMGELTYGTGNLITGKRLRNIFDKLGYNVFMYNVKYINESEDIDTYLNRIKHLLINNRIHLIVGIHLWRSGRVISLIREKLNFKIPSILVVSGTDANVFINVTIS